MTVKIPLERVDEGGPSIGWNPDWNADDPCDSLTFAALLVVNPPYLLVVTQLYISYSLPHRKLHSFLHTHSHLSSSLALLLVLRTYSLTLALYYYLLNQLTFHSTLSITLLSPSPPCVDSQLTLFLLPTTHTQLHYHGGGPRGTSALAFIFNPPGRPKGGPILPTAGRLNRRRVGEAPLESFRGF